MKLFRRFTLALCLVISAGFATVALADDTPGQPTPKPGSTQVAVGGSARGLTLIELLLEDGFYLIQAWLI